MKRTVSLILIMVMLLSILVGCNKNGDSDISSDLPEVTNSNTEQVENNSTTTESENNTTESSITEENSTATNSETTNTTTTKPNTNSNNSQTTKPNKNSTTSSTTTKPSTSNSTTSNNNSSSGNTSSSTVADNYVYRNPTVYVDGMYKIGSDNLPNTRQLGMGDVYVEKKYVENQHTYCNSTTDELVKFDASHIVTDVNKMPSNYKLYAYVVDTIPNWLYEKNMSLSERDITPLQIYLITYDNTLYYEAMRYITEFYFSIGCISYDKKDADEYGIIWGNLSSSIYAPYHYPIDDNEVDEYERYVKENKIKLTTVAEPLLPIVYCKGDYTFIRTKVTVKAESPVTNNIKMFLHDGLTLKNGENVFYIDVPLASVMRDVGDDWFWVPKVYVDKKDLSQYIIG